MHIQVKTLQNQKFTLEVEATDTVVAVKERLEKEHNVGAAVNQKLIFQGAVLRDEDQFGNLKISPNDFVVVMVSKPKPAAAPAAAEPAVAAPAPTPAAAPAAAPAPAPTPAAAPAAAAPTPAAAAPAPSQSAEPVAIPTGESAFVTGAHLEATIMQLMEMGFERDQVVRALKAAFNNPERAVEYLFSGIPESVLPAAAPQQAPAAAVPQQPQDPTQPINLFAGANQPGIGGAQPAPAAATGNLDFLRNSPQFQQLRRAVRQNPDLLQPLMQQLGQANPQLAMRISQNAEEFMTLLAEDDGSEGDFPPTQVIQLTQEERDAVERLEGLGFSRARVIEAYLACDRNEELAANYLFDSMGDDDMQ